MVKFLLSLVIMVSSMLLFLFPDKKLSCLRDSAGHEGEAGREV